MSFAVTLGTAMMKGGPPPPWGQWGPGYTHARGRSGVTEFTGDKDASCLNCEEATQQEVEAFFDRHPQLDDRAKESFAQNHKKVQKLVMMLGDMTDALDQSKVLMSRCIKVNKTRYGSWLCNNCAYYNFKTV